MDDASIQVNPDGTPFAWLFLAEITWKTATLTRGWKIPLIDLAG